MKKGSFPAKMTEQEKFEKKAHFHSSFLPFPPKPNRCGTPKEKEEEERESDTV